MSIVAETKVAKKKVKKTVKIEVMAEPEWAESVKARADRMGVSLSVYIRLAVNEKAAREDRIGLGGEE